MPTTSPVCSACETQTAVGSGGLAQGPLPATFLLPLRQKRPRRPATPHGRAHAEPSPPSKQTLLRRHCAPNASSEPLFIATITDRLSKPLHTRARVSARALTSGCARARAASAIVLVTGRAGGRARAHVAHVSVRIVGRACAEGR